LSFHLLFSALGIRETIYSQHGGACITVYCVVLG
jgi:hypothetical protein